MSSDDAVREQEGRDERDRDRTGPEALAGERGEEPTAELDDDELSGAVEALLIMATEPMSATELAQALRVPVVRIERTVAELTRFYRETRRGFELRHAGGGWRYATRAEHAGAISAYVLEGQHGRLSQAALETLAVIAYLQPATRSRIAAVRGVNVDGVVRTLLARELVVESGRDEQSGAALFVTTPTFLERMGLASLDDLPPLAPHLPDASELEAELAAAAQPPVPVALGAQDGGVEERRDRDGGVSPGTQAGVAGSRADAPGGGVADDLGDADSH